MAKHFKTSAHIRVDLKRLGKPLDAGQRNFENPVRVIVRPRPLFGRDLKIRCAFNRGRRNDATGCHIETAEVTTLESLAVGC